MQCHKPPSYKNRLKPLVPVNVNPVSLSFTVFPSRGGGRGGGYFITCRFILTPEGINLGVMFNPTFP